jgi:hypothetical protein
MPPKDATAHATSFKGGTALTHPLDLANRFLPGDGTIVPTEEAEEAEEESSSRCAAAKLLLVSSSASSKMRGASEGSLASRDRTKAF